MSTRIATWNLTNLNDRVEIAPLPFGSEFAIDSLADERIKNDPLILYILGHAVPNALEIGSSGFLGEAQLARNLLEIRGELKTLVVFDLCFAESFATIAGVTWPPNFGLIFSCKKYERAWHTGEANPRRQSLFSAALVRALLATNRTASAVEAALIEQLGELQTPIVEASLDILPGIFQ